MKPGENTQAVRVLARPPLVLVIMHFCVIRREETYLEELFGQDCRDYKAKVRRWP
jgi:protein-S-isoprenylcysteine O-methyltransferase Ste14